MPSSGVRAATMADAGRIGAVNVAAWRERLTGILSADALDSLSPDDLGLVWASGILNPPTPQHLVLVAVEDDDVLGYAAVGPSADPDADDATAELIALEVDPAHQRSGHGSRLVSAVADLCRDAGVTTLSVWCPVADEVRRGFLQSAGWGPDTARRDLQVGPEEGDIVREVRLVTAL